MSKKIRMLDIFIIGFAFFATYFGAGNLIFPPMMGLQGGSSWVGSIIGMTVSAIAIPVIALFLIEQAGSVQAIMDRVSLKLYPVFQTFVIFLTLVISVPRTAATAIELGIKGSFPSAPYRILVVVYFLLIFLISRNKESVLDRVGKYLTPVMVVILFVLIFRGVVSPLGAPSTPLVDQPFFSAFVSGYQTGDLSVSVVMAVIFFSAVTAKGYSDPKSKRRMVFFAGLVTFVCMFAIYGGLLYMGACVSGQYPADIGQAELLVSIIKRGGQVAISALGIAVVLACMTTAAGQVAASAEHLSSLLKNKVTYSVFVVGILIFCGSIALLGVDRIVSLTMPLFGLTYPPMIVLLLLQVFHRLLPNDGCSKGAFYLTVLYCFIETLLAYGMSWGFLRSIVAVMPFSGLGFGWIVPFVVGLVGGSIVWTLIAEKKG